MSLASREQELDTPRCHLGSWAAAPWRQVCALRKMGHLPVLMTSKKPFKKYVPPPSSSLDNELKMTNKNKLFPGQEKSFSRNFCALKIFSFQSPLPWGH